MPVRVHATSAAAVGAMFVGAAVAGCGTPQADDGGLRELTHAEEALVERVEEQLVKECMEKEGFKYWPGWVESAEERQGGGYVLYDVAWARKYGYGTEIDARAEKARLADRNAAYTRALSGSELIRYNTALDGDPENGVVSVELPTGGTVQTTSGGCRAQSLGRLYGDFPAWFRAKKTAQNLTALYVPDLLKDPRFKRAVGAWADCMNEAGHPYADPPAIRAALPRLAQGMSPAAARATEVEIAVAEATCATATPLVRTGRDLDREYRDKKLAPYHDALAAHQRMNLTALARAKALTGPVSQPTNH